MKKVILALGGNVGDVAKSFDFTIEKIESLIGPINKRSSRYKTEPWGIKDQDYFLNMVLEVSTNLSANEVLTCIINIEKMLGRNRKKGNQYGPRTIDIDILFYSREIINDPNLVIPHPRLHQRNFVLTPLMEIAPGFLHPVLKKKIKTLFAELEDKSVLKKI